MNRINLRGIEKGVQKHSKTGAKASDIVKDITSYSMKSFKAVVVFVGGNGASSKTDIELFEEKYDKLISLIKQEPQTVSCTRATYHHVAMLTLENIMHVLRS